MVVGTFDSDVFHLPCLVRVRSAAGAKPVSEQRFDLFKAAALGLWQAAVDEEEAQQRQAGVEKESSWEGKNERTHRY